MSSTSTKSSFFKTYLNIAFTNEAKDKLIKIWKKDLDINDLKFSTKEYTKIAFELAIRDVSDIDSILNEQYKPINNKERKDRFNFIKPALSNDDDERNQFFENLKKEENREKEPWVSDALKYFHHPLRNNRSIKYISPSLELLKEIQITGDIFFPTKWLEATFKGHSSIDAVTEVNLFLNENPSYPQDLKNKILQSTDLVHRSSVINNE